MLPSTCMRGVPEWVQRAWSNHYPRLAQKVALVMGIRFSTYPQ